MGKKMKILITGGTGMVGSAFERLKTHHEIVRVGSKDSNLLRSLGSTTMMLEHKPDAVIHLAARVGGVKANTDFVAEFFDQNIKINMNVLRSAHLSGVPKVLSLLSTCIYPDDASYPLTEEQINDSPPHQSNFGYAYAKRMLDVQSRAYRQQYGCNFITAVPNNLFGENDNYHLEDSHVIPAMMHKMLMASRDNSPVHLWGDGSPLREFTYSRDLAQILLFLIENYDGETPINVGNTNEISIRKVALKVKEFMGFEGEIVWDTTKPKGQFRKPSSNRKLIDLGWSQNDYTPFDDALKKSCEWFKENYPNVRGS
jgi:GDP-L-fucose synthase